MLLNGMMGIGSFTCGFARAFENLRHPVCTVQNFLLVSERSRYKPWVQKEQESETGPFSPQLSLYCAFVCHFPDCCFAQRLHT